MYKFLHWIFGWDYIAWETSASSGIARVQIDKRGRVFFWEYRSIRAHRRIMVPERYLWLTCSPSKYFPDWEDKR